MSDLQKTPAQTAIDEIFAHGSAPRWTVAEEQAIIQAAKDGDAEAIESLLRQYAPAMKAGVAYYIESRGRGRDNRFSPEDFADTRQNAMLGVLEAVQEFNPAEHDRLAAIVRAKVDHDVTTRANADVAGLAVPQRSLSRWFSILRAAGGNVYEAAAIAPDYAMTRETFFMIHSAVREVRRYDAEEGLSPLEEMDAESLYGLARTDTEIVEDAMLVQVAFDAVDSQEADVVRHSYGFMDYEAQSDAEVAHRLGLSRPKVQRVRSGALAKMRDALGVE